MRSLGRFARQNAIALLALFVALGGTSYAAAMLPKNSVGTAQIKNGAVTKSKISKSTVTALADGRAVVLGNVAVANSGDCQVGAPEGVSTAGSCEGALDPAAPFAAVLPAKAVFAHFTARISEPVASDVQVEIWTVDADIQYHTVISCSIPAGKTSCSKAIPSAPVAAGTRIVIGANSGSSTNIDFGYEVEPG